MWEEGGPRIKNRPQGILRGNYSCKDPPRDTTGHRVLKAGLGGRGGRERGVVSVRCPPVLTAMF